MQGVGFGRKGVAEGLAIPQRGAFPAQRSAALDSDIAAKRAAFIAAERAYAAEMGEPVPVEHDVDNIGYSQQAERIMQQSGYRPTGKAKSMGMAYLWWFILGQVSAHRFYLGDKSSAIQQLGMFGGSLLMMLLPSPIRYIGVAMFLLWMLWVLADMFLIPGLCRKANQALTAPSRIFE